jgi:hypothetical protein
LSILDEYLAGVEGDSFSTTLKYYFPDRIRFSERKNVYNSSTRKSKPFWLHIATTPVLSPLGADLLYRVPAGHTLIITEWGARNDNVVLTLLFTGNYAIGGAAHHQYPWDKTAFGHVLNAFPDGYVTDPTFSLHIGTKCRWILYENETLSTSGSAPMSGEVSFKGWLIPDTEMTDKERIKR